MDAMLKLVQCLILLFGFVFTVNAIECYQCNTAAAFNQSWCESGPFTGPNMIIPTPCLSEDGKNYTRCRKSIQWVLNDTRTVRSCATQGTTGDHPKCQTKIGTANVKVMYCECSGMDGCNGSSGFFASILLVATAFTAALAIFR